MGKIKNIAITSIMLALLLLTGTRYAFAQNSAEQPYVDSWHKYRVGKEVAGNNIMWTLQNDLTAPTTTYTLTDGLDHLGETWVDTYTEAFGVGTGECVDIKFLGELFAAGQTWYLIYSEWDGNAGTGNCVAKRSVAITITSNDFKLWLAADNTGCNSFAGNIWTNADDLNIARTGTASFTVNLEKNVSHLVKSWTFDGEFSYGNASYKSGEPDLFPITRRSGSTTHGTWAITAQSGNTFTMVVTVTNYETDIYDNDQVTFTPDIIGPAITDIDITLVISNAVARSGTNYTVNTDDIGTPDEHNQTRMFYGIPNTSYVSVSP